MRSDFSLELFRFECLRLFSILFLPFFFAPLKMSLFPSIFVPLTFSLCMESKSYVFSFRMVFFYLVTTGWIFDFSLLCENSINQNRDTEAYVGPAKRHQIIKKKTERS